ncbi:tail fiber protein [Hymenobacter sp. BT175]|uniref:phage tail protein n=1 Tax=Hymenobacter translucens TaxID=2886507 RepID=UPI001D0F1331|nr:tail fiber protein [Hymenobacter translucens]MCC2546270.1 tail fiber protein [Hymenobacter translucens]
MDAFIGEIRLMGFDYAPNHWALCQGQLLPISTNQALYSLLGTTYGGDGRTTFALPNLNGRVPMGVGNGTMLGTVMGSETVTLTIDTMPAHIHAGISGTLATALGGLETSPNNHYPSDGEPNQYGLSSASPATMAADELKVTIANAGGSQPHENRQPFMALNYAICINGYFPPRS